MTDLSRLARQAESRNAFVASKLAAYQQSRQLDDADLATELGCEIADLTHLRLCSLPRLDHFQEDLQRIAAHSHVNATKLTQILSVA